jgi:choline dehydrogenase-like flavoprotein
VIDGKDRRTREVFGRVIVLAASAFESVRILLNSACPRHPEGIGGSSGVLGRFVGDHLFHWAVASVSSEDEPLVSAIAEPADAYDWAPTRLYIPDFWQRTAPPARRGRYGVQISLARSAGASIASMTFHGEMTPRFENRLTIDPAKADAWGIPVVNVDCTHSDRDEGLLQQMREAGRELAVLAGMEPSDPTRERWPPGTAIHETGGARMGNDRRRSVLNQYNQCWDCENVFVTDGACFPYAPFASPTLTIMALAVRTCDYILRHFDWPSRARPSRVAS